MNPLTLKALIAATMLVATGGFAAGTIAYFQDAPGAGENHAQATFGGRVIDAWSGAVDANVTTGTLDFRTFHGAVHVVAWDRPAFEVTLLAPESEENAQELGDAKITPAFTSAESADALHLALNVTREGTVSVTYGTSMRLAVVAFVPDVEWTRVNACSGVTGRALAPVSELLGMSDAREAECLERESMGVGTVSIGGVRVMDDAERPEWDVPFALVGLTGGDARLSTEYDALTLENVTFDAVTATTEYGAIKATGLTAENVTAFTEYGDVWIRALRVTDVTAGTEYGDVTLDTDFRGAASATLGTEYGDVKVHVPGEGARGYRVTAATEYGNLRIRLPGVTTASDADEEPEDTTAVALPQLAAGTDARAADEREERTFKGETEGFESFGDRLTLRLVTEYGDVRAAASGENAA